MTVWKEKLVDLVPKDCLVAKEDQERRETQVKLLILSMLLPETRYEVISIHRCS